MRIPITNRKVKKILKELEKECYDQNPGGYALFGQLMTHADGEVDLTLGTFTREEYLKINEILKNRTNKSNDAERNKKLQIEFTK